MKKRYSTKRAFIASLLVLCMCFTMLVGTTFAWFTDSVTSAGNIIQSGTLKIDMSHKVGDTYVSLKDNPDHKVFDYANWEPGYTSVQTLMIENEGSLALKYRLDAYINGGEILGENGENLADVIDVYMCFGESTATSYADLANGSWWSMGTLTEVMAQADGITSGKILPAGAEYDGELLGYNGVIEGSVTASIALHMREEAGNEYQGLSLGNIYLTLFATQWTYEEDSFGDQYDADAFYPVFESATEPVVENKATKVEIYRETTNKKVMTALFPVGSLEDDAEEVTVTIEEKKNVYANVTVESDQAATTYEIKVEGLKENNDVPVQVYLYIGEGKTNVKLYHYDELYPCSYVDGYLVFFTTEFSPFTAVYDVNVSEEPFVPGDVPTAVVTPISPSSVDIAWGEYEELLPSDLSVMPECLYSFKAPAFNVDTDGDGELDDYAIPTEYRDWLCDFWVSMDRDVPEGALFLCGQYDSFGDLFIGFENPEAVTADTKIPLLGYYMSGDTSGAVGLEYEFVVLGVGEFVCGVAHLDSALDGATFTVELRMTNPEDVNDYYIVNVVNYTFGALGTAGEGEIVK